MTLSSVKYKALMIDVDGTLVPNRPDGMPSVRVTQAINKIQDRIHVGLATGRPLFAMKYLAKHLQLSGVSIVSGGAQVVHHVKREVVWEKAIPHQTAKDVFSLLNQYELLLTDGVSEEPFSPHHSTKKVLEIAVQAVAPDAAEEIIAKISGIPNVVAHPVRSWTSGRIDVLINQAEATKQHGIYEVAKALGIETHEIIGIGDGGNDLPLLMACGLKIAMEDGNEDLKAIADYIAPSVEKDGVAHVIEKFLL